MLALFTSVKYFGMLPDNLSYSNAHFRLYRIIIDTFIDQKTTLPYQDHNVLLKFAIYGCGARLSSSLVAFPTSLVPFPSYISSSYSETKLLLVLQTTQVHLLISDAPLLQHNGSRQIFFPNF